MSNNLPIEEPVCSLEHAKELAGLLGDDAPDSLWVWWLNLFTKQYELKRCFTVGVPYYPAYTGDEFDVLLPAVIPVKNTKGFDGEASLIIFKRRHDDGRIDFEAAYAYVAFFGFKRVYSAVAATASQAKANLAIQGLKEGWIKKEDFKYE